MKKIKYRMNWNWDDVVYRGLYAISELNQGMSSGWERSTGHGFG